MIADGKAATPFMAFGDTIKIEMLDADGKSIFGAIDQQVHQFGRPKSEPSAEPEASRTEDVIADHPCLPD